MKKVVNIGTVLINGRNEKVFLQVNLEDTKDNKKCFTISGVVAPRKSGNALGSCGQIINELDNLSTFNKKEGWTVEKVLELKNIWTRWHLNDLRAGTPKQEKALENKKLNYDAACEYLKSINLYNDNGYVYGTAWLCEELPQNILSWFDSLENTKNIYAWV